MSKKSGALAVVKKIPLKGIIAILIVAAVCIIGIGLGTRFLTKSDTTKLGFEDIGELATQAAYAKEVNVTEGARELFGITIPFTQSKYIYSYAVTIKAGFDFGDIDWSVEGNTITVRLPQVRILSTEIDPDSFELYLESESIFRQITMEENNEALKSLRESAEKNAVANGLLDNAQANAETILTAFFANEYDLSQYTLRFVNQ